MSDDSRLYAEVHTSGEKVYLPLDEIEHRLKLGQIGLDAHIDCPSLTGDTPKPIWMIDRLAECADTPEARMMEHLRSNRTPWIALLGLFGLLMGGLLQQRGWISIRETGVGWAPITLQDRWWTPWTYWLSHLNEIHWVGNGVLYYFCAQRVERIVGSHSLIQHLSIILLGSAFAIWVWESGTVIGASTLVFGLWAMQVGWGFRLAHSLPPKVQAHYGWGNFLVFVPALVLNVLSTEVSHVAHWTAMGVGFGLSARSTPLTSRKPTNRKYRALWLKTLAAHMLGIGLSLYLMQKPLTYSDYHSSDAGFSLPIPDRFDATELCNRPAWTSEGMTIYSTGRWIRPSSTDPKSSLVTTGWHACEVDQVTCTETGTRTLTSRGDFQLYPDTEWQLVSCYGDVDVSEYVVQRGELLLRVGCVHETPETQKVCAEWLSLVTLEETRQEKRQFVQWKDNDQRGDRTLEYADQLIRVGRIEEADALLVEVESRFDGYKWRGTEKRLGLHLQHSYDWNLEREWLLETAQSIPVDEIAVLRLVVLVSNERGWCDIGTQAWSRWRVLMPTSLDEIGGLVKQCNGD